jgi:hypothetical protein
MARTIKIHYLGRQGMEVQEVGLAEANQILLEAETWGWIVGDAKTHKIIWEISPTVEEIMIIGMLGGG